MLVKVGSSGDITSVDRLTTLIHTARGYALAQIKDFINSIRAASVQLRQNANPQLVLEVLMLAIPEAESHVEGNPAAQSEVKYG